MIAPQGPQRRVEILAAPGVIAIAAGGRRGPGAAQIEAQHGIAVAQKAGRPDLRLVSG